MCKRLSAAHSISSFLPSPILNSCTWSALPRRMPSAGAARTPPCCRRATPLILTAWRADRHSRRRREMCVNPPASRTSVYRPELNRLELTGKEVKEGERYKKIGLDFAAVERLLGELFIQAHGEPPKQIVVDLDSTDDPLHGNQEGRFFHGYYGHYCYLPLYIFCGERLLGARCARRIAMGRRGAWRKWPAWGSSFGGRGRRCGLSCAAIPVSAGKR